LRNFIEIDHRFHAKAIAVFSQSDRRFHGKRSLFSRDSDQPIGFVKTLIG